MKEYKVLEFETIKGKNISDFEKTLNQFANEGWRVVSSNITFSEHQIIKCYCAILERNVQ